MSNCHYKSKKAPANKRIILHAAAVSKIEQCFGHLLFPFTWNQYQTSFSTLELIMGSGNPKESSMTIMIVKECIWRLKTKQLEKSCPQFKTHS